MKSKFGIGELVVATVMGTRDKTDEKGHVCLTRDENNRELVVKEPYQMRATFTGKVVQIHGRQEGDGTAYFSYDIECPHRDRAGSMWVEEAHLAAVPVDVPVPAK